MVSCFSPSSVSAMLAGPLRMRFHKNSSAPNRRVLVIHDALAQACKVLPWNTCMEGDTAAVDRRFAHLANPTFLF